MATDIKLLEDVFSIGGWVGSIVQLACPFEVSKVFPDAVEYMEYNLHDYKTYYKDRYFMVTDEADVNAEDEHLLVDIVSGVIHRYNKKVTYIVKIDAEFTILE